MCKAYSLCTFLSPCRQFGYRHLRVANHCASGISDLAADAGRFHLSEERSGNHAANKKHEKNGFDAGPHDHPEQDIDWRELARFCLPRTHESLICGRNAFHAAGKA